MKQNRLAPDKNATAWNRTLWRHALALALCLAFAAVAIPAIAATMPPQGRDPQLSEPQTGPVTEPRNAETTSGPPPVKGAAAITQITEKCATQLVVNADALFRPGRWTLEPYAPQTLDVLGPMIAKAGKHPVRIDSYIAPDGLGSQSASKKRAITVRGWLVNHGYVPEATAVAGFTTGSSVASGSNGQDHPAKRQKERVEVVIEICK